MADKKYTLNFCSCDINNVDLYKSSSGYNYASVGVRKGKKQYISISYEWQDETVPDFILDMVDYFSNKDEDEESKEVANVESKKEFDLFMQRLLLSKEE